MIKKQLIFYISVIALFLLIGGSIVGCDVSIANPNLSPELSKDIDNISKTKTLSQNSIDTGESNSIIIIVTSPIPMIMPTPAQESIETQQPEIKPVPIPEPSPSIIPIPIPTPTVLPAPSLLKD